LSIPIQDADCKGLDSITVIIGIHDLRFGNRYEEPKFVGGQG
jgi:hypothetical protein